MQEKEYVNLYLGPWFRLLRFITIHYTRNQSKLKIKHIEIGYIVTL